MCKKVSYFFKIPKLKNILSASNNTGMNTGSAVYQRTVGNESGDPISSLYPLLTTYRPTSLQSVVQSLHLSV